MTYHEITKNGVDQAPPLEFPTKRLTISTVVSYRGRTFTVSAEGWTMDRLCDMLDEKFGSPSAAPNGGTPPRWAALPPAPSITSPCARAKAVGSVRRSSPTIPGAKRGCHDLHRY